MSPTLPAVPAHLAQFLKPLRASAPVVQPRDKRPVFEPSQGAHHRAQFVEMPELETHDMPMLCDNNTDHLSFACDM